MKNRILISFLLLSCLTLWGWANIQNNDSKEKRHRYTINANCSFKDAFTSVIELFQDQGFVIQKLDSNIGLIIARGSTNNIANSTHIKLSAFR